MVMAKCTNTEQPNRRVCVGGSGLLVPLLTQLHGPQAVLRNELELFLGERHCAKSGYCIPPPHRHATKPSQAKLRQAKICHAMPCSAMYMCCHGRVYACVYVCTCMCVCVYVCTCACGDAPAREGLCYAMPWPWPRHNMPQHAIACHAMPRHATLCHSTACYATP